MKIQKLLLLVVTTLGLAFFSTSCGPSAKRGAVLGGIIGAGAVPSSDINQTGPLKGLPSEEPLVPVPADCSAEQRMMIVAPRKGVIMTTVAALTTTVTVVTTDATRDFPLDLQP